MLSQVCFVHAFPGHGVQAGLLHYGKKNVQKYRRVPTRVNLSGYPDVDYGSVQQDMDYQVNALWCEEKQLDGAIALRQRLQDQNVA